MVIRLNQIIKNKPVLLGVFLIFLAVSVGREAGSQNYSSLLVSGLLRLDYPLTRGDVVALDNISMRFDAKNRIDVLKRILRDRNRIYGLEKGDSFEKTEVICNALRLLNEMELPVTRTIIEELVHEEGWQEKEHRLLSYMAAKRDIDFDANVRFLIASMPSQETDLQKEWGGEISLSIMDICDNISFLTELFIYHGDRNILEALIRFARRAYGYPKEYLSHMFVEIFLQRPVLFIDIVSEQDDQSVDAVVDSLLFAVWRNDSKSKVDALFEEELAGEEYKQNRVVRLFKERFNNFAQFNDARMSNEKH